VHDEAATPKDSSGQAKTAAEPVSSFPKQFNFARHWKKKIAPLLNDLGVRALLMFGLVQYDPNYRDGHPPWRCGRGPWNGQRAREGCLSWYQPWGRCHFIAPFSWALARKLFPDLQWGFVTGDYHTVVIGWKDGWENPLWVMDILLFREKTAQQSLQFARAKRWTFCPSMAEYVASFCHNSEAAVRIYRDVVEASLEVASA
jgi:hypothetical protein